MTPCLPSAPGAVLIVNQPGRMPAGVSNALVGFGDRWAKHLMPPALMQWMRHRSIETTLRHCATRSATDAADTIWAAADQTVNISVNSGDFRPSDERNKKAANPCE
jgi:hypothetical protein